MATTSPVVNLGSELVDDEDNESSASEDLYSDYGSDEENVDSPHLDATGDANRISSAFRTLHVRANALMDANEVLEEELRLKDTELDNMTLQATETIEACKRESDRMADSFIAKMSEEISSKESLERLVIKLQLENSCMSSQLKGQTLLCQQKACESKRIKEIQTQGEQIVLSLQNEIIELKTILSEERDARSRELRAVKATIGKVTKYVKALQQKQQQQQQDS